MARNKDDDDNRSRQLNPENDAYWQSRGYDVTVQRDGIDYLNETIVP